MNCKNLISITDNCNDNNLGSIKNVWIVDYSSVDSFTLDEDPNGVDPGVVTALMANEQFVHFSFTKNTSSYTEDWQGDIAADVHLWASTITIGLRRIEVSKRNAIMVLAEGRRQLVVIVEDNNGEFRVFGLDDGMRLTAMTSGTNESRDAGTFYTITLSGEDKWMAPSIDKTLVESLIPL